MRAAAICRERIQLATENMSPTRPDLPDRLSNRFAAKVPARPDDDPDEVPESGDGSGRDQDIEIDKEILDSEDDTAAKVELDVDWGDDDPVSPPANPPTRPQPSDATGVHTDMATLALDTRQFAASQAGKAGGFSTLTGSIADMSDADIMLRVREGDDTCFNYLIEKYRRPIMSFMFRMVHNQAIAEELAQEVFLRVYRSRGTYRAEAKFTTWMYRIATNLGVNHARDTKYERAAQNVYLDEPDAETGTTPDLADSTPTVEQDLVTNERFRAIRQHVMALPERQRTAVLMHKYQGMDYKQIGEVLKLSESATKSLLFRAYQTLREKLKDFV
jgi:RNA polymerase sigma-70 factor (ECF subfamily)